MVLEATIADFRGKSFNENLSDDRILEAPATVFLRFIYAPVSFSLTLTKLSTAGFLKVAAT